MERKYLMLLAIGMMAASNVMAQKDDLGMWSELGVEKKISKKLSVDGSMEYRMRDNLEEIDRVSVGVGATYKIASWLKAGVAYAFLYDNNHKLNDSGKKYGDYWGTRHRASLSLTGAYSFGRLGLSLRERYQYTYRPEATVQRYYTSSGSPADTHTYAAKSKNVWRNKLQLKYKLNSTWRPYLSGETYVADTGLDKIRYALGTEIRVNKKHSFDVKYLFQNTYKDDDNEGNRHVIGLGYNYKF